MLLSGVGDYAPRAFDGQSLVNLCRDLLRCVPVVGVIDHTLREDSSADDDWLTGHLSRNLFDVVAT